MFNELLIWFLTDWFTDAIYHDVRLRLKIFADQLLLIISKLLHTEFSLYFEICTFGGDPFPSIS